MDTLGRINWIMWGNLGRVWPLLVITVPFAALLRSAGIAEKFRASFSGRPVRVILVAAVVGAFGPFCSCSVIPVVASMLMGGVPLPAVMTFWVASPTMDPEIFFLSVAFLGWDLAVGRFVAAVVLSLAAGFLTLWLIRVQWIETDPLRARLRGRTMDAPTHPDPFPSLSESPLVRGRGCEPPGHPAQPPKADPLKGGVSRLARFFAPLSDGPGRGARAGREAVQATLWVAQFMVLGLAVQAVIQVFVPGALIGRWVGRANPFSPLLASIIGVPFYTSNLTAVPLIGGLLGQGMGRGAALAFLITGPVTTLPAMAAVWGVVKVRVFLVYLGLGLVGGILFGHSFDFISWMFARP